MTMLRDLTSYALMAAALTTTVYGQEATPSPSDSRPPVTDQIDTRDGVGLDEAIARALDEEPSLRAVRSDIDVARGDRLQAGLRPNPTLSVERRDEPAGTDSLTSVGIQWPLDLFRRGARVATADRAVDATLLAVSDRERILAADVRTQYGVAAAAVRDVAVADDLVRTAARQRDIVGARADAGRTPPLERDLLEVELRRFETARLLAQGRADAALVELKRLLGMAPEASLRLRETLEALVVGRVLTAHEGGNPASMDLEAAASERADVKAAEARVALADARVDQAGQEGRFDVSLFGSYMRMDAGFSQQGFNRAGALERVRGRFDYVTAGAMVTLPAFNRNQGSVAAAKAERAGAEARRDAAALAARAEIAAARARAVQARKAVRLYGTDVLRLARQNLDVVTQTFDLGRATVYDVLAEQRRLLDTEQAYTAALRDAWMAHADLTRALGAQR